MPTPKIKLKRSSTVVTTVDGKTLDIGEPVIDVSNPDKPKLWIGNNTSPAQGTKVWIGAAISSGSGSSFGNDTSMVPTVAAVAGTFLPIIGGSLSGSINTSGIANNGTITSTSSITSSAGIQGTVLTAESGQLRLKETGGSPNEYITIQAPAALANSDVYTWPSSKPVASTTGVLQADENGNLSWATDAIGVGITASLPVGTTDYFPVFVDSTGTKQNLFIDNVAGFVPVNGPLKYTPNSGTLTVNGDLIVNGKAAQLTPQANNTGGIATSGVTTITYPTAAVASIFPGDSVEYANLPSGVIAGTGAGFGNTATTSTTVTAVNKGTGVVTLAASFAFTTALNQGQVNVAAGLLSFQSNSVNIGVSNAQTNTATIFTTDVENINIGGSATVGMSIGTGATTINLGNSNASGTLNTAPSINLAGNGSNVSALNVAGTTGTIANTTATTINAFGAATSLNLGGTATANAAANIMANTTASGNTKTLNIGTGGASGSTTTITIGSSTSGATNSITVNGLITNAAGTAPGGNNDALVTKGYVDTVATGLNTKGSAVAATTATLASITGGTITYTNTTIDYTGGTAMAATTGATLTIDGVNIYYGDGGDPTSGGTSVVILVKNEATAARNGLYYASGARQFTRISTANEAAELPKGTYIFITGGTTNSGKGFITKAAVTTLGSTAIDWDQFTQSNTFTGTGPIVIAGNQISLSRTNSLALDGSNNLTLGTNAAGNGLVLYTPTSGSAGLRMINTVTVKAAATSNINLSADVSSVDGQSISVGDYFLCLNQDKPFLNGVWQRAASSGVPIRPGGSYGATMDSKDTINAVRNIFVSAGTSAGKTFSLLHTLPIKTVATSASATGGTPIVYTENITDSASFSTENLFTIGAPVVKSDGVAAAPVAYNLKDMYASASSIAAGGVVTYNFAGTDGDRNIPENIIPGLKVTKIGSTDMTTDSLYVVKVLRTSVSNPGISIHNRGTSSVNITQGTDTAGSGTNIELEQATSNSYYSSPKGIMAYNKNTYTEWSALAFTPNTTANTEGTWSVINSLDTTNKYYQSYPLLLNSYQQTITNKILDNGTSRSNNATDVNVTPTKTSSTGIEIQNGILTSSLIRGTRSTLAAGNSGAGQVTGQALYVKTADLTSDLADINIRTPYYINASDGTYSTPWFTTSPATSIIAAGVSGADRTYAASASGTILNTIDVHNLRPGARVVARTNNSSSTNITDNTTFYVIVVSNSAIKLANSYANAIAGTASFTSSCTIGSSSQLYFIANSVDITLGSPIVGSAGYLKLPSGSNSSYEYVIGDIDDINATAGVNTYSFNSFNKTIQTEAAQVATISDQTQSTATLTGANYTTLSEAGLTGINEKVGGTNATISSIDLTSGSASATITFSTAISGTGAGQLSVGDYVTICGIALGAGANDASDSDLLNFFHRVTAVNVSSNTAKIQIGMRRAANQTATKTITNGAFAIKNYEIIVAFTGTKGQPSPSLGERVTFSLEQGSGGGNTNKVLGTYTEANSIVATNNATHTITTIVKLANQTWILCRFPYPLMVAGSENVIGGTGWSAGGRQTTSLGDLRGTASAPSVAVATYTGRRVLLNTLIDCGTY